MMEILQSGDMLVSIDKNILGKFEDGINVIMGIRRNLSNNKFHDNRLDANWNIRDSLTICNTLAISVKYD
jgi:hypothetical protein